MAEVKYFSFHILLSIFQIILIAIYAKYVYYETDDTKVKTSIAFYPNFQDVHVMIFIGFGFLMTFLKKYAFGAVSYNMLISSIVIQWALVLNKWLSQRVLKSKDEFTGDPMKINLQVSDLMTADFTAAAVLITFGAILGKASKFQLLIVAIFECVFFAINEIIIFKYLYVSDVGGSIVVHSFGAYFGLAVSLVLQNYDYGHENEESVYHSDLFSMIGTLFLWVFWPTFNAGVQSPDSPHRANRAIINTYLALAACVCSTFITSSLVDKHFKLNMVHIQNATLAGGVAVGTSADLMIRPWGAILIGIIAGILSVLGYNYVTPFLAKKCKIHDTCGVNNLHGMPAILAAICAAIAAASIDKDDYSSMSEYLSIYSKGSSRSRVNQGGYQFAAAMVSFSIAVAGGLITGVAITFLDKPQNDELFDDKREFLVPEYEYEKPTNKYAQHKGRSETNFSQVVC